MKKIIGTLLALTMMFGACPSMLAENVTEDAKGTMTGGITWFEPIQLNVERFVVDNNGNSRIVLNSVEGFPVADLSKLKGTKIKGTYTYKDTEKTINVDVQITGQGADTGGGKNTLLFDNTTANIVTGYPKDQSSYSLTLYPADKITKHNCIEQNTSITISRHGQGQATNGGSASRINLVAPVSKFPFAVTSENIEMLKGCLINGTITNGSDKSVTFTNSPIEKCELSGNEVKFQPAVINGSGCDNIGGYSSGTTTYDLTISPAPYDADVYASYVAAEGTAAAAAPFDKSHVTGAVISGVVNTGAKENTISTGFIKEVSQDTNGTQHWEIKLPAEGSYVKAETNKEELNKWITMNLGDAVVTAEDGSIYPISSFTVSEEDKDYIILEFDCPANSTTITTGEGVTTTVCGLIIENIYAPGAKAAIE